MPDRPHSFLDSKKIKHWPWSETKVTEGHSGETQNRPWDRKASALHSDTSETHGVTQDVETDYPTTTQVSDTVKPKETLGAEGILGAAKNRPECDQGGEGRGEENTLTDQDLLAMSELDAALSDLPTESMDRYAALHGHCCWNCMLGFKALCMGHEAKGTG